MILLNEDVWTALRIPARVTATPEELGEFGRTGDCAVTKESRWKKSSEDYMTFAEREWIVRNELSIRHIKLTDEERLGAVKQEESNGDSSSKGTPVFYTGNSNDGDWRIPRSPGVGGSRQRVSGI